MSKSQLSQRLLTKILLTYVRRKRGPFWSLEGLFETIARHLPKSFMVETRSAPAVGGGPLTLLRNLYWARGIRRDHPDCRIFHVTGDIHYATLALRGKHHRVVLTIHDLRFLEEARGWRRRYLKLFWVTLPCRAADIVTVISEATRDRLIELGGVPPGKIRVIPDCLIAEFRPATRPPEDDPPLLLQVGTTSNKNLYRVAEACAGLDRNVVLHILGRIDEEQSGFLSQLNLTWHNDFGLPWDEVVRLYECCTAVLFVSTYEGFGLPILEAQAVGRPILTSDLSPMREVSGGGALLVDPSDVVSIREGIRRLLDEESLRTRLVEQGFRNLNAYRPEVVAGQYAELYGELAGGENFPEAERSTRLEP